MRDELTAAEAMPDLAGVRVLAALNSLELFGHERANIEVFKTLRHCGAEVYVGVNARNDGGDVNRELQRLGFPTFPLPFNPQWSLQFLKKHPSMLWTNPWAALRCARRFRREISEFKPTHIHIGSPLTYSYLWSALARTKIPMVYRMGDCPPIGSRFNLMFWNSAMRRSSMIVANSEFVHGKAMAAGVKAEKLAIIYSLAPARELTAEPAARHDEPFDANRIVYVGAVAEHKGLIPLVEAIAALASERPAVRLDICGGSVWDGEFREQLQRKIRELGIESHIRFHGHVDDPSEYYRRAAVHVVPSMWDEPSANVVFEAKREGAASVVFPSGGLPEVVRHEVDGFICSARSTAALVEGIRWMFADADRLKTTRAAARADYIERFGPTRFARQWGSVYRRAATESRPGTYE
jgi:glycosyltransferase involved in cell wall biosynthesis